MKRFSRFSNIPHTSPHRATAQFEPNLEKVAPKEVLAKKCWLSMLASSRHVMTWTKGAPSEMFCVGRLDHLPHPWRHVAGHVLMEKPGTEDVGCGRMTTSSRRGPTSQISQAPSRRVPELSETIRCLLCAQGFLLPAQLLVKNNFTSGGAPEFRTRRAALSLSTSWRPRRAAGPPQRGGNPAIQVSEPKSDKSALPPEHAA